MKSLCLSVLGLAFVLAPQANVAHADGLLDPFNVFSSKKNTTAQRTPQKKPGSFMSNLKMPAVPKMRVPKFNWFSRPKQGSTTASIDRKLRTNWARPKKIGSRTRQAMTKTKAKVSSGTAATYNATTNALSPSKNIRRVQGVSENLSRRFATPPNTAAKDYVSKQENKKPWYSALWSK